MNVGDLVKVIVESPYRYNNYGIVCFIGSPLHDDAVWCTFAGTKEEAINHFNRISNRLDCLNVENINELAPSLGLTWTRGKELKVILQDNPQKSPIDLEIVEV